MNNDERKMIKTLNMIGVDTRYISLYNNTIYINNLKFSKFSKKREKQFNKFYPEINVLRQTLFQKICIKTSRLIKKQIKPKDIIYIEDNNYTETILLKIILEPYKRKYGITFTDNINTATIQASSKSLDEHVFSYILQMFNGEKITDIKSINTIYPLIHVPYIWIQEWIKLTNLKYTSKSLENNKEITETVEFLDSHIPNVKEIIQQSVEYLDTHRLNK